MNIKAFSRGHSLLILLGVLITFPLTSCKFCPRPGDACDLALQTPGQFNELTDSQRNVVFEQVGTIIVFHGSACAQSRNFKNVVLQVEQSLDLPAYATNATVFLNGWRLRYLDGDHNVAAVETSINNIRLERNTLKWQASGLLADDGFDESINWCYNYTVLGWNPANLNLVVDHKDGTCDPNDHRDSNFFVASNDGTTSSHQHERDCPFTDECPCLAIHPGYCNSVAYGTVLRRSSEHTCGDRNAASGTRELCYRIEQRIPQLDFAQSIKRKGYRWI